MKTTKHVALRFILILSAICLFPATAQSDPLNSYHRALDLLQHSLEAHGGLDRINSAGGFEMNLEGTFDLTTRLQGRSPLVPEPTPIIERVVYDAETSRVAYDVNWYNYYSSNQDLREVYDSYGRVLFVDKLNRNGGWLPRHTVPDSRERITRLLPHLLLNDALAQRKTVQYIGRERHAGRKADVVRYTTTAGELITIYIDTKNHLVNSASSVIEMPLLGDTQMTWSWIDYTTIEQSLQIPSHLEVRLGERILKTAAISFELGADQSVFGPPDGIIVQDPPEHFASLSDFVPYGQRAAQVEEILPGVFMVNGLRAGFRVLFVEFKDFVLAVDAPTGWYEMNQIPPTNWSHGDSISALARKLERAIHDTLPDKPLRYVVLSHHHSDHIGGLRAFAETGVTFVAGEAAASMAKNAFNTRSTLTADTWDDVQDAPTIEVVQGERVIADESMVVKLIELPDGNPKADNFLMVYLPRQKLLYSTAFIYPIPKAVFPPKESIPLSRYFVDWLDNSGLKVDHIYNLHGMGRVEPWQLETIRNFSNKE